MNPSQNNATTGLDRQSTSASSAAKSPQAKASSYNALENLMRK